MRYLFTICIGLCCSAAASAQSIGPAELNGAGGSATVSGNTYEYAIGSLTAGSYVSAGLVVTPGVLQPRTGGTGVHEPGIDAAFLQVFPNPADHILYLQPRFGKAGTLSYVLTDVLGRTMLSREIALQRGDERQEINMGAFTAGQYTINIRWQQQGRTSVSAYKIQKVN